MTEWAVFISFTTESYMRILHGVITSLCFLVGLGLGARRGVVNNRDSPPVTDGFTYGDHMFNRKPTGCDGFVIGAGSDNWLEFRGPARNLLYKAWQESIIENEKSGGYPWLRDREYSSQY